VNLRRALALFDPRGRLSAPSYRHRLIRLLLAFFGLLCSGIWLAALGLRWPGLLIVGANLFVALAALAQTARRLHDRDRTAWWLALYVLMEGVSALPLEQIVDTDPVPVIVLVLSILGFSAWFIVETVLRTGKRGPNRYGPAPAGART
jgi:uncharacterized membrane protein YhaH (DUF805 family)